MSSSAKGLAGRYAGALYALAEEAGKVDAVVADMTGLAELVSGNDEMKTLVGSPAISWTADRPVCGHSRLQRQASRPHTYY